MTTTDDTAAAYNELIRNMPTSRAKALADSLTLDQRIQIEQNRLLYQINSKFGLLMFLILAGLLLSMIAAFVG
jgi:hypothetical protein